MTFNLRLSRAHTGVVEMRQDSNYYCDSMQWEPLVDLTALAKVDLIE